MGKMVSPDCYPSENIAISTSIWQGGHPLEFSFSLLSLQLVLMVLVTRSLYFLLKPLKQPRVVSEIVGGLILGPSGLGRNSRFRDTVFPNRGKPVLNTISSFGLMYVIFLIGVQMDPGLLRRSGKKPVVIGVLGLAVSFVVIFAFCLIAGHTLPKGMSENLAFRFSFAVALSVTSFAVLAPMLSDLNLLNSELGQIALSAAMTNDGLGWLCMTSFVVLEAGSASLGRAICAFCAISALLLLIFYVVRPLARWVVENTPPGKPVNESYVFVFLLIVLVVGFFSDIIGTNSFHGALVLGLAIPDGPPLGATIAEKTEALVSGLLLPLYYVLTGSNTDLTIVDNWHGLGVLIVLGLIGNLVGTLLPSLYFGIPFRDALSLSSFMNCKGLVEVVAYNFWWTNKLIDDKTFAIMMLAAVLTDAVAIPIATILYEPSRRYTVYKRRTVQHHKPGTEFRVLTCVHDQAQVPTIINLLEASAATANANATAGSQLAVYALHLVELVGRAAPLFIPHKLSPDEQQIHHVAESEHIANAFLLFEQRHRDAVSVHPFTTISPYASMHDEICRLAVEKRTSLAILPFHKSRALGGLAENNNGLRTVNRNVLANPPCSVGVLVDSASPGSSMCTLSGDFTYDIAVFFFGGADDREALALGGLMASHPGLTVTVVRFLPSRSIRDDQAERKLDSRALDDFRLENKRNERVVYREALVRDMEEIVAVIRAMDERSYDLVLVGTRHISNSVVSERLDEWADCPELGVIGDMLASSDFTTRFSVLVVRQQDETGLQLHQSNGNGGGPVAGEERPPRSIVGQNGTFVR